MPTLLAYGLFILLCFIAGLGLAYWILPGGWKRFVPSLALPCSIGVFSALAWWVARYNGPPIEQLIGWYWAVMFAPLALVLARSSSRRQLWRAALHRGALVPAVACFLVAATGAVLALSLRANAPATVSTGSCDAPDYAIGMRMLRSFERTETEGFLGQKDVHGAGAVGSYYDFWLNLNHFSSAATGAWLTSTFNLPEHAIVSLLSCFIMACIAPATFVLGRKLIRLPAIWALLAGLYTAIHPNLLYAHGHVAIGQLAGTLGAVLCLTAVGACGRAATLSGALAHLPLVALSGWLVLGGYHLMSPAVLGACSAFVLILALTRSFWPVLGKTAVVGLLALGLLWLGFADRARGAWMALTFFGDSPFGWSVPSLTWSSLHGVIRGVSLDSLTYAEDYLLDTLLILVAVLGAVQAVRRRQTLLFCLTFALVIVGLVYFGLILSDHNDQELSSYKANKLASVFIPVALVALTGLWHQLWRSHLLGKILLGVTLLLTGLRVGENAYRFYRSTYNSPLAADHTWLQVRALEHQPDVRGVNILCDYEWDRLWASVYLLGTKQYFKDLTYWGHNPTPLLGSHNLTKSLTAPVTKAAPPERLIGPGLLLTPVTNTLAPDGRIDFIAGGNLARYLHSGLATPGAEYTRSASGLITLTFRPESPTKDNLFVQLVAHPYEDGNDTPPPQKCEISVNDEVLFKLPFVGPGVARFMISRELWNNSRFIEIKISLPDATPADAPTSPRRGLAIRWLSLTPQP